jgi:DNA (cytosine-5)-methyltransferase 1
VKAVSDSTANFRFADLFCGIGGFHLAMSTLGGHCVYACDIDQDCQDVYERNFGIRPSGDIRQVSADTFPDHDVLCAGFPCQSFSKAGHRLGMQDARGTLFFEIARIIEAKRPPYLVLENVRNLIGHDGGNTWRVISTTLRDLGYEFQDPPIVFSPHYLGIPQIRERVVVPARRRDIRSDGSPYAAKPQILPRCSIWDVMEEGLCDTAGGNYGVTPAETEVIDTWNDFIQGIGEGLPGFPMWADEFRGTYPISPETPQWRAEFLRKNRAFYERNAKSIDSWLSRHKSLVDLPLSRHKFEWQAQDSPRDLWELVLQLRPSGLRVKPPSYFPALVAITQTSIVGHLRRRITPREAARLQSFPDWFVLHSDDRIAYRQLGNAVNADVIGYLSGRLLGKSYPLSTATALVPVNESEGLIEFGAQA